MCFYSILIPKDQSNIDLFSFGSHPLLFSLLPPAPHELSSAMYELEPNWCCVAHSREGHSAKPHQRAFQPVEVTGSVVGRQNTNTRACFGQG